MGKEFGHVLKVFEGRRRKVFASRKGDLSQGTAGSHFKSNQKLERNELGKVEQ